MKYLNNYYAHLESLKLDIGCGMYPKNGFVGIDNFAGIKSQTLNPETVDKSSLNVINHDLNTGIPFETDSVDEVVASHFLEHVNNTDTLLFLLEEVNRVLRTDQKFEIIVPYANSAEGMYPGHNFFFTEKWFLNNILFTALFEIRNIIFYESEYYHSHKKKLNKVFTFDEARMFLSNCCWQMQIISTCRKGENIQVTIGQDIEYAVVPYGETALTGIQTEDKKITGAFGRLKSLFD